MRAFYACLSLSTCCLTWSGADEKGYTPGTKRSSAHGAEGLAYVYRSRGGSIGKVVVTVTVERGAAVTVGSMWRAADRWLAALPLWWYAPVYFALLAPMWVLAVYIAAWSTGGVAPYDVGFTSTGHLSGTEIVIQPGSLTVVISRKIFICLAVTTESCGLRMRVSLRFG